MMLRELPFLITHISRYKATLAPSPPHAPVGPAAKIEMRTFVVEVQVCCLRCMLCDVRRVTRDA